MSRDHKVLFSVLVPLNRSTQFHRKDHCSYLILKHRRLYPKASSDPRRNNANLVFWKIQRLGKKSTQCMGELCRSINRKNALVFIKTREHRSVLDRCWRVPVTHQPFLENVISFLKRIICSRALVNIVENYIVPPVFIEQWGTRQ